MQRLILSDNIIPSLPSLWRPGDTDLTSHPIFTDDRNLFALYLSYVKYCQKTQNCKILPKLELTYLQKLCSEYPFDELIQIYLEILANSPPDQTLMKGFIQVLNGGEDAAENDLRKEPACLKLKSTLNYLSLVADHDQAECKDVITFLESQLITNLNKSLEVIASEHLSTETISEQSMLRIIQLTISSGLYEKNKSLINRLLSTWLITYEKYNNQKYSEDVHEAVSVICTALLKPKEYELILHLMSHISESYRDSIYTNILFLAEIPDELKHIVNNIPDYLSKYAVYNSSKIFTEGLSNAEYFKRIMDILNSFEKKNDFVNQAYVTLITEKLLSLPNAPHDILNLLDVKNYNVFPQNRTFVDGTQATRSFYLEVFDILKSKYQLQLSPEDSEKLLQLNHLINYETTRAEDKNDAILKYIGEVEIGLREYDPDQVIIKLLPNTSIPHTDTKLPNLFDHPGSELLPLALQIMLLNNKKDIPASFKAFYSRFDAANKHAINEAGERISVDYAEFMLKNTFKIANLYDIMGDNVFLFMRGFITSSAQQLDRYFSNLRLIPTEYYPILKELSSRLEAKPSKTFSENLALLVTQIGQLESIVWEISTKGINNSFNKDVFIAELKRIIRDDADLTNAVSLMSHRITTIYKQLLSIPDDVEIDTSVLTNDSHLLSRLLTARKDMNNNQLSDVFDKMIEYDLRKDKSFRDFSSDPNQSDTIGKSLSKHNKDIENELQRCHINTDKAFNYDKTHAFSTKADVTTDIPTLASALYQDILQIEQALKLVENPEPNMERSILKLLVEIDKIRKQVEGREYKKISTPDNHNEMDSKDNPTNKKKMNINCLYNKSQDKIIANIHKSLTDILHKEDIPRPLREHGGHYIEHKDLLLASVNAKNSNSVKEGKIPNKEFIIAQWDKNNIKTFLLGDYLSCCLAPDGGQFPAMVQRRMDDAMMMHVIYDKDINQPICGNWLFLARDKNNPDDIYVVANFCEIRASYGLNSALRDKLVAELLAFTENYSKEIGAMGFIMRPLTYGLIPDFKNDHPTRSMTIEKVGGFYSPVEDLDDAESRKERYYLKALEITEFYVYTPKNVSSNTYTQSGTKLLKNSLFAPQIDTNYDVAQEQTQNDVPGKTI